MKRLLLLATASALLVSAAPNASKKNKSKEKSFEPVASSEAGGYTGHYVGIESSHWADVNEGPSNRLEVILYEGGAHVPLRNVLLTGSRLTATKLLGGGAEAPFEATFGERRVNGKSSFGLLVEGEVRIDGDVVLDRLFYRRQ